MVRERPTVKNPHCKICGHDHSGPCTECLTCVSINRNMGDEPAIDIYHIPPSLENRVAALEKRLDAIDSRRKYQREYMRNRRKK